MSPWVVLEDVPICDGISRKTLFHLIVTLNAFFLPDFDFLLTLSNEFSKEPSLWWVMEEVDSQLTVSMSYLQIQRSWAIDHETELIEFVHFNRVDLYQRNYSMSDLCDHRHDVCLFRSAEVDQCCCLLSSRKMRVQSSDESRYVWHEWHLWMVSCYTERFCAHGALWSSEVHNHSMKPLSTRAIRPPCFSRVFTTCCRW